MKLQPGLRIGPYEVLDAIGRGGMGAVYRARDTRLDRVVALKTLPPQAGEDRSQLAALKREARTLAALKHPRIASIYALEEPEQGTRVLVLEHIEGRSLAETLREGPMPVERALEIGAAIADALDAAHRTGIVHRDLKPSNVMLTPDGQVKVLDFGIATRRRESGTETGSMSTAALDPESMLRVGGTPGYMSPEQVQGLTQDARTDVFSWGCVLFECLSGQRAFPGKTLPEIVAGLLQAEPDWDALPHDVPEEVTALLRASMRKSPAERIGDASSLRDTMEAALRSLRGGRPTARPVTGPEAGPAAADPPSNLPRPLTTFIGREPDLAACRTLLRKTRLLSLIGAGGGGKTRLAIRLAESQRFQYPGGLWYVNVATVSHEGRIASEIAHALKIREEAGGDLARSIATRFGAERHLLLLDACERYPEACARLAETLLRACAGLTVLVTTRERLAIAGEQVYVVAPLSIERPGGGARGWAPADALLLFQERARQTSSGFAVDASNAPLVADICRRLDGIPLAIELAAALVNALSLGQIRERLDHRLTLLGRRRRSEVPHHETLRAAIDWSYDLLDETERSILRGLGIFEGGFTLEGISAVCGADHSEEETLDALTRLVDKSQVFPLATSWGETRYRLLDTVREYAMERLREAGEAMSLREHHVRYYLDLARRSETELRGPDQVRWSNRLAAEHDNFAAALAACDVISGGANLGLTLAGSLRRFWFLRGELREGRLALERALRRPGADAPTKARARALESAASLASFQADQTTAERHTEEASSIYRALEDDEGIGRCFNTLGNIALGEGLYERAREAYTKSLAYAEAQDREVGAARVLQNLGGVNYVMGDRDTALAQFNKALEILRRRGDRAGCATVLQNLGEIATALGDYEGAHRAIEECIAISRELEDRRNLSFGLHGLARLHLKTGTPRAAATALDECLQQVHLVGERRVAAHALELTAAMFDALGRPTEAAWHLGAAEALRAAIHSPVPPEDRAEYEALAGRVRGGGEDVEEAWKEGAALDFEEMVIGARARIRSVADETMRIEQAERRLSDSLPSPS